MRLSRARSKPVKGPSSTEIPYTATTPKGYDLCHLMTEPTPALLMNTLVKSLVSSFEISLGAAIIESMIVFDAAVRHIPDERKPVRYA